MRKNFDEFEYFDDIFDSAEDFILHNMIPEEATKEFKNGKMVIAENCEYNLDDYKTRLCNNVLIVGSVGCGKTRHIVTPNIYEAVGSYVITDPKGNLYKQYGDYLRSKGYDVKLLDFTNPKKSVRYNPFAYIKNTHDILKLSSAIVADERALNNQKDPFWERNASELLNALIGILYEMDKENGTKICSVSKVLELLRKGERPYEESKCSVLSQMFEAYKLSHPDSWAYEQFKKVDAAPTKTYDSVRATLFGKLVAFDTVELKEMLKTNDFYFRDIADRKTAIFITVSDTDRSLDDLVNLFYTQAMNELCYYADTECVDNRLPIPVRFILDDFATNCKIKDFPRMISSFRSRAISVMLMIQAESQLTACYGDNASTIIANCDTYAYLGGNDINTQKAISERTDRPFSEIASMPIGDCWIFRRGSKPVSSRLVNPEKCIEEMIRVGEREREAC
ncbi:MAG: type IV secretory system conjugative DNA transfer family protein [Oscillospiraceae bacterium]|nr:type IV secretory system conjugative DNA transfer family protein [Oscillospiraceae bacterium]